MKHDTHFDVHLSLLRQKPVHLIYWIILSTSTILVIAFEKYILTSVHLLWHVQVIEARISLGYFSYVVRVNRYGKTSETWLSVITWYLICEATNQCKDQDTTVVHYLRLLLAVIQELAGIVTRRSTASGCWLSSTHLACIFSYHECFANKYNIAIVLFYCLSSNFWTRGTHKALDTLHPYTVISVGIWDKYHILSSTQQRLDVELFWVHT